MQSLQYSSVKCDWNIKALATFSMCWCFLCTTEFFSGVSGQEWYACMPFVLYSSVKLSSGALSERTPLTCALYCLSIIIENCGKTLRTSAFGLRGYTHVTWVWSSTIVKKCLYYSVVGTEKGPHMSMWSKSKALVNILLWAVYGKCFCLARWQMEQWNFALFLCEMQSTSVMESTLAIDGWPSLLHHNYVSTTTFI